MLQCPVAITSYNGKSVAEQNSIGAEWSLLTNQVEGPRPSGVQLLQRDRDQAVSADTSARLHGDMANDLFDKDLKAMRESRWEKSFSLSSAEEDSNRRATIVPELVIQASGVSHTMQHFTVYSKWNRRLFAKMDQAYQAGRSAKDPAIGCYEGDLCFYGILQHRMRSLMRWEFLGYANDNLCCDVRTI